MIEDATGADGKDRECNGASQMPLYKCHKEVFALKIKDIGYPKEGCGTDHTLLFEETGFAPIEVSKEYIQNHNPEAGGYYVVYKDGYKSFSPAKAFEDGYTLID